MNNLVSDAFRRCISAVFEGIRAVSHNMSKRSQFADAVSVVVSCPAVLPD